MRIKVDQINNKLIGEMNMNMDCGMIKITPEGTSIKPQITGPLRCCMVTPFAEVKVWIEKADNYIVTFKSEAETRAYYLFLGG